MKELAVERKRTPVTIKCVGIDHIHGELFLSPFSKKHSGQETVLEFMNEPEPFFVLKCEGTPPVRMINKEKILSIRVALETELSEFDRANLASNQEQVTVVFDDSFTLSGNAYIDMPPVKSRLVDFLNQENKYILLCEADHVYIINRMNVNYVIPGER